MKKILSFVLVFIIFFEITSIIFTKFELFVFNEIPKYAFEVKSIPTKTTATYDWLVKDKNGNFSHKKNYKTSHSSRCFDVTYEFNNVGAKDYNDYFVNSPEKSIMLVGDSFAEGYGVDTNKIFAKIIEKKIGKKVLNFGISGTDTKQQNLDYVNVGSKFNFDELIHFFFPHNDYAEPLNKKDNNENIKKKVFLLAFDIDYLKYKFSFLKYRVADLVARFTYSYNFIRSISYILDLNLNNSYKNLSYFNQNEESIAYTFKYLENIIKYKSVKSYIVIIPTIYDINNVTKNKVNYKNLLWYKKITQLAERNNTILIDLMDFIDFKEKHLYFHSCDGHWNEYGNEFAANSFLENYIRN